jgi:hypothetical protein
VPVERERSRSLLIGSSDPIVMQECWLLPPLMEQLG